MRILIALGGNLPFGASPPIRTIAAALDALAEEGLFPQRISRMYNSPAFPVGSGPDYVNAAAELTARHPVDAQAILQVLHGVEARFGRERHGRWQGRTLDIDLLAAGDSVMPNRAEYQKWAELPVTDQAKHAPEQLILPHPRMQDRAFVLVPLADIAPDWRHPVQGRTVREMLESLPKASRDPIVPVDRANFTG